ELFIVFLFMKIVVAIMWVVVDYQEQKVGVRTKSIKGLVQFMAIIVYFLGSIVLISIIVSKSPLVFIGGLSAISAVLMLVFKDSILGLVAGVQLSNNDMVRIGDWITMSKYNADGTVMDITLTTVKVQNFDLTITTIPTYNLITDSVTNWRGMQEAGGRRIQRSIYIDITTIHFCTEEMLLRFSKVDLLKNYIQEKNAEIKADNTQQGYETFENLNGRSLTNIGVFRKYVELYLKNHPRVSKLPGLTLLVRQQAADEVGMPIQIYCFLNTTDWLVYEEIQSDIFDHLLAAIPFFDLSVYERTAQVDNRWCK
ncbi:MAG: mechanosensitive ion channel, partial [Bacteroidales bacterium]